MSKRPNIFFIKNITNMIFFIYINKLTPESLQFFYNKKNVGILIILIRYNGKFQQK
jgi:hypothetical protein